MKLSTNLNSYDMLTFVFWYGFFLHIEPCEAPEIVKWAQYVA